MEFFAPNFFKVFFDLKLRSVHTFPGGQKRSHHLTSSSVRICDEQPESQHNRLEPISDQHGTDTATQFD